MLGFGFIFSSLPLRLLPVLNCLNVFASKFLVKFMDSLDKPRRQIGRRLGFGFRLRFGFCYRFRLSFDIGLRL